MTDQSEEHTKARLEARLGRDLLRFITCGSVDDGKSTLIGRLLVETQAVPEDQMASLEADSRQHGTRGGEIDYALLLDGLAAEREQAITIDVAYRYLSTPRRTFIIADTPGHEQYTRNMATGASTADLALLLVDARKGLLPQTMRHATIVQMVGVRSLVLLVNKMDLVGWSEARFQEIVAAFSRFAAKLEVDHVTAIPVSAIQGDNVASRSGQMPWYKGPALLEHLEQVPVDGQSARRAPVRFPVQWVNRPDPEFRGFAGTLVSGTICPGQGLRVLPKGSLVTVSEVWRDGRQVPEAVAGEAITLTFREDVDVSRGDLCCAVEQSADVADQFEARLLWLVEEPLHPGRSFRLKMGTRVVQATVTRIKHQLQVETLEHLAARSLGLNAVAVCNLSTDAPLAFDAFSENRHTGSFILIDRLTLETVAAGVVRHALRRATNIVPQAFVVDRDARAAALGQRPAVLWFTGLSGAGKSTLANLLEQRLHAEGRHTFILDGDNVRHGLCRDLGFTETDRIENLRRVSEVARLMVDAGLIVLVTLISPYRRDRERARGLFGPGEFHEIHVDVALAVAEERDPKGLYRKARRGELAHMTGVDAPYEPPESPELRIDTSQTTPEEAVDRLMALLDRPLEG